MHEVSGSQAGSTRGVVLGVALALLALGMGLAGLLDEPVTKPPPGLEASTEDLVLLAHLFDTPPRGASAATSDTLSTATDDGPSGIDTPSSSEPHGQPSFDGDPEDVLRALAQQLDRAALADFDATLVARLRADPNDLATSLALCETARLLGRPEDARQYGEHAVQLAPESALAHARLARALAAGMRGGQMLVALRSIGPFKEHLKRARELDPDDFQTRGDEVAFLSFAPALVGGDVERALQLAEGLVQIDPVPGLLFVGLALMADDRIDDAERRLRAGLITHDDDRRLHMGLGTLLVQAERFDEAETELEQALVGDGEPRDGTHWQAIYGLARLRIKDGRDHEQVAADLEAYLAADPYGDMLAPRWGALHRYGQALAALGRTGDARTALEACLALNPGYDEAEQALAALDG